MQQPHPEYALALPLTAFAPCHSLISKKSQHGPERKDSLCTCTSQNRSQKITRAYASMGLHQWSFSIENGFSALTSQQSTQSTSTRTKFRCSLMQTRQYVPARRPNAI